MKKYFIIKNWLFDSYYSQTERWDHDIDFAMQFETKKKAISYGQENSLGFCVIEEFYNFC